MNLGGAIREINAQADDPDAEFQKFDQWKNRFKQLEPDDQVLYCLREKLNPQMFRIKQSASLDDSFASMQIGTLKIYDKDVQLFCEHYLDMDTPQHQTEIFLFIEAHDKSLILEPRDHGKSKTVGGYCVKEICFDRNTRIKYYSKNEKKAKQFVDYIKNHLGNNRKITRDFGKFRITEMERRTEWSSFAFTVDRSRIDPNPTVEALGQLSAGTGGRADIIIFDDFFDYNDANSQKVRKNISDQFWGEIRQLLEEEYKGKIVVIGTRKHYQDLYNEIILNPAWSVLKRESILTPFTNDDYEVVYDTEQVDRKTQKKVIREIILKKNFEVLWPSKFDARKLLKLRTEIGPLRFEREMQNNPSPEEGTEFRKTWIKFWHTKEEIQLLFNIDEIPKYLVIDTAISEKQTADYTGMAVIAIDPNTFSIIVLAISYKRESLDKSFNTAIELCAAIKKQYHVGVIEWIVEAVAIFGVLEKDWPTQSPYRIKLVKTQPQGKGRIRSLGAKMENGQFWMNEAHDQLLNEIIGFPDSDDDHILDAIETGTREIGYGSDDLIEGLDQLDSYT